MPDAFESEVQKFVSRQNGDELTPQIVYAMLQAVDKDGEERHQETKALLEKHCTEASVRDIRIAALEEWRRDQSSNCEHRIRRIIEGEHAERHSAHMAADHPTGRRATDPPDEDFSEQRGDEVESVARKVWVMWGVGMFLAVLAANTIIAYLLRVIS